MVRVDGIGGMGEGLWDRWNGRVWEALAALRSPRDGTGGGGGGGGGGVLTHLLCYICFNIYRRGYGCSGGAW